MRSFTMPPLLKRVLLGVVCAWTLVPLLTLAQNAKAKNQFFNGNVAPLAQILAKDDIKLDADAGPYWLALKAEDGKIYPLLKDAGSRMFFKDAKLLNRPMRLTGRLVAGGAFLQVVNVHSVVNGKLHDVYYWCDICTIKGFEAGICDCCGDPMDFRETPAKE